MSFIVKHYTCPVFKVTKIKIFKHDGKNNVQDESTVFLIDELKRQLSFYKVKNPLYVECKKLGNIEVLNNPL